MKILLTTANSKYSSVWKVKKKHAGFFPTCRESKLTYYVIRAIGANIIKSNRLRFAMTARIIILVCSDIIQTYQMSA